MVQVWQVMRGKGVTPNWFWESSRQWCVVFVDLAWVDRLWKVTRDDWIGHEEMITSVVRSSVLGAKLFQHASDQILVGSVGKFIDDLLGELIAGDLPPPVTEERIQGVNDEVLDKYGANYAGVLDKPRVVKGIFHKDELRFQVENLWFEVQLRVGIFLKQLGVCTFDPDIEAPNLQPFFCEDTLSEIEFVRTPQKIETKLMQPYRSARCPANSQLIPTRRANAEHVLAFK